MELNYRRCGLLVFACFVLLLQSACSHLVRKDVHIDQPSFSQLTKANNTPLAGAVSVDITPPPGLSMGGYSLMANEGQGFRTRLKARVIYLSDVHGGQLVYVQTDLGAGSLLLHHSVAQQVADELGLSAGQITIAGTHSHSAPANMFHNNFYNKHFTAKKGLEEQFLAQTANRIANGIRKAYVLRRPAKIATGKKDIYGVNRNRAIKAYARNKTVGSVDLKDPQAVFKHVNPELNMIRIDVKADNGQYMPLAALSAFSVHATTVPAPVTVYNADLFAYAQKDLQWHVQDVFNTPWPAVHALSTATQGDMAPAVPFTGDNYFTHKPIDWKNTKKVGQKLGRGAIALFDELGAKLSPDLVLASASREVNMQEQNSIDGVSVCAKPSVGMPTTAGALERRTPVLGFLPFFKGGFTSRRWFFGKSGCHGVKRHAGTSVMQKIAEPTDSFPKMALFQVHRINDAVIMPVPFEVTTESGRRMVKAAQQAFASEGIEIKYGWVASVSNGYFGYTTTPEEYSYQNYEGGHTLYGKNSTPYITKHLQHLAQGLAQNKGVNVVAKDWIYNLDTAQQIPDPTSGLGVHKQWVGQIIHHQEPKNARAEPYVLAKWQDVAPANIAYHKPLVRVEEYIDGAWQLAKNGSERLDDDGYDLEVKYNKSASKQLAKQNMGQYQVRWYNPIQGKTYRFVILPRLDQMPLYSPGFTL